MSTIRDNLMQSTPTSTGPSGNPRAPLYYEYELSYIQAQGGVSKLYPTSSRPAYLAYIHSLGVAQRRGWIRELSTMLR